jgi:hypothetical protein
MLGMAGLATDVLTLYVLPHSPKMASGSLPILVQTHIMGQQERPIPISSKHVYYQGGEGD